MYFVINYKVSCKVFFHLIDMKIPQVVKISQARTLFQKYKAIFFTRSES